MTKKQGRSGTIDIKAVLAEDEEFLRALVRTALQEVLEAEMTEALGAEKGERAAGRQGYRSGYYGRTLITRVGKLELRVPQDRAGRFSTELFERYQRSERALVGALAEMYVQGVSTRKVKAITEELCGHSFSASSISAINQRLDDGLAQFAGRPLAEAFPYLQVDFGGNRRLGIGDGAGGFAGVVEIDHVDRQGARRQLEAAPQIGTGEAEPLQGYTRRLVEIGEGDSEAPALGPCCAETAG